MLRVLFCYLLTLSCFGATLRATHEPRVLALEARDRQYVSHGPGYALSVTSSAAFLNLNGHQVRMSVVGASPNSPLEALDRMPGTANYIFGGDVRASYHLYGRIRQRAVYPGIDLIFRGNQEHLEYDFEVAAGRHPERINLAFEGVDDIRLDPNGDLVLQAGAIQIHQPKPVAYQFIARQKQPVDVAYRIDASHHIRFRTGPYNQHRLLVIDPQIVFDNSFGGSSQSSAAGLARDPQGNLYVTGTTSSTDFATLNPLQAHLGGGPLLVTADAGKTFSFSLLGTAHSVSVLAAAPSAPLVIYAVTPPGVFQSADGGTTWTLATNTELTGTATALAVDASSPTTLYAATAQGLFVSTDGAASWRASNGGITGSGIVAVIADPAHSGTVFASVQSPPALFRSTDFGQTWTQLSFTPNQLLRPVNAIVFGSNRTIIAAVADQGDFLPNQGLFISTDGGDTWTTSPALPVPNNQTLAISPDKAILYLVTSFSAVQRSTDGGQNFSTVFHDGVHLTQQARVAVDPRNPSTVYVSDFNFFARSTDGGQTWSQLPLPNSVNPKPLLVSPADSRVFLGISTPNNVFVTKWSADGSQVLYSTYLGGSARDSASAIAVDANGSAYVTGVTSSSDFPTTPDAFQTKLTTSRDVFVAKLSPDGSQLLYSTLLGSQSASSSGMVVDSTGIAVLTGFAPGNFPVTANAFQSTLVPGCYMFPNPAFPTSGAAFVTRIAPDGKSLVSSTLFGGSCSTSGGNVALDASGNAWITGATLSPDLPATADALQPKFGGGVYDGFLARFNPSGGLGYATYLGGAGYDALSGIALDRSGNIYVTGSSGGLSQPASAGAFQPQASASCPQFFIGPSFYVPQGNALVMKLDPTAHSIQRLTYLGAPLCLFASSIAVDSSGQPWIAAPFASGGTPPTANPFAIGVGQGFISKFSADFTQLLFSTYFDSVSGLALDSSGSAYVAGATAPLQAYLAKIDPTSAPISLDSVVSPTPAEESFCNSAACPPHPAAFRGIAPGELIRILGKQMGPASGAPGVIQSGALATTVAGVQVTFDGVAVPLLSVSAQEIDLIAPFELATKSTTTIQVQYNGVKSNPVQVAVTGVVLQILGVFNEDFSVNTPTNPAQAGSVMILYVSGAGQTNPPSRTGQVNTAPPAAPGTPLQIKWFSSDFKNTATPPIAFAGSAPGLAAGILQINFIAPQQSLMDAYLYMGNISARFNISVQQ
jgi:uncharacterized protein (TIGR03437 family)